MLDRAALTSRVGVEHEPATVYRKVTSCSCRVGRTPACAASCVGGAGRADRGTRRRKRERGGARASTGLPEARSGSRNSARGRRGRRLEALTPSSLGCGSRQNRALDGKHASFPDRPNATPCLPSPEGRCARAPRPRGSFRSGSPEGSTMRLRSRSVRGTSGSRTDGIISAAPRSPLAFLAAAPVTLGRP
jgi:hypothetical protein